MSNPPDIDITDYPVLPSEFFPPCWSDDQRMAVLLAPFRPKEVNPINYHSKLNFWSNLIRKYCETKGCAQITLAELRHVFLWNQKKPYALETVLQEMSALGEILNAAVFMEPPQHTWRGWAQRSMTKAIAWPILKVKDQLWRQENESDKCFQPHVVCSVVKNQASQLLEGNRFADRVINIEEIFNNTNGLTREGTELALHQLHCTKQAVIKACTLSDGTEVTLVKLAGPTNTVTTITENEQNLYDLNATHAKMTEQSQQLEHEILQLDEEVRQNIRENKKTSAKVLLRKKKVLETKLDKCVASLNNLQSMMSSIDDTKQTAEILSTYKLASSTLKKSYIDTGVTVEAVDDALDEVKEALDDHRDIQDVMTGANTLQFDASGVSDAALEAELDELLEQDLKEDRDKNLDESIERRLRQLNINGFADLSLDEQRAIISNSVGSVDELLKHNISNKKMEATLP